jgi:hypothetical protein
MGVNKFADMSHEEFSSTVVAHRSIQTKQPNNPESDLFRLKKRSIRNKSEPEHFGLLQKYDDLSDFRKNLISDYFKIGEITRAWLLLSKIKEIIVRAGKT